MTTTPDPLEAKRKAVIFSDAERKNIRRKAMQSIEAAKHVLNPQHRLKRFVDDKKLSAKRAAQDGVHVVKDNAGAIGAVGLGALLVAARHPISKWITQLRNFDRGSSSDDSSRNRS